jgi:hypothetical protein
MKAIILLILLSTDPQPPKQCTEARKMTKAKNTALRDCENSGPWLDDQKVSPPCEQQLDELTDARCAEEIACTPSTKDPKDCKTAVPRG